MRIALVILVVLVLPVAGVWGQSSSLFLQSQEVKVRYMLASSQPAANGVLPMTAVSASPASPLPTAAPRNVGLVNASLTAIAPPEPKLIQINDLVTVIVRHRLRYQSEARTNQQSRWDLESTLEGWFRLHDHQWVQQDFQGGTPEIKFENKNNLQNQGRADRKDLFETRVMAKVIDVKPNGNLILVASNWVHIGEEQQQIRLTGECNRSDVGPDNSVLSDKVFDLKVDTDNDGAMQDLANRGWLKRLMDDVKPF